MNADQNLPDDKVFHSIVKILEEMVPPETEIGLNTDLGGDLSIDSLKSMEILAKLEDEFDITIPINVLSEVRTVEDLVRQIKELI